MAIAESSMENTAERGQQPKLLTELPRGEEQATNKSETREQHLLFFAVTDQEGNFLGKEGPA
jgi:hypothetical protein